MYSICFCFKSSIKSLVSFSASKYFMTGFYFKDLLPRISVLITVSSSHRFQGTHKLIWVYHFLSAFCFSYEQRNVHRWMLYKYVGNMIKESTLLNNEHEHVKRYYAYKDITLNIENISQNISYTFIWIILESWMILQTNTNWF